MSRWWYASVLIPAACLAAIALYHPVYLQPQLTMAGDSATFRRVVASSGGVARVQRGFYLDFGFIAIFASIVPMLLYRGHGWWPVPVCAATLDVTEDIVALVLLHRGGAAAAYAVLWVVAALKLAAYAATLVAMGVSVYRG